MGAKQEDDPYFSGDMSKERRLAICHGGSWANSKCLFHSKSESTNQPSAKGGAGGSTWVGTRGF